MSINKMKQFKANKLKFFVWPTLIMIVIISYIFILMRNTSIYLNIINISIDIMIILLYFILFIYEIKINSEEVVFKSVFSKKSVLISELISIKQGGILTFIETQKGKFFIISSKKEKEVIKNIFKDIQR